MITDTTICRNCGHTYWHHDGAIGGDGDCWYGEDGDDLCLCSVFVPPVEHNPIALEYIGAAFLVWRELFHRVQANLMTTMTANGRQPSADEIEARRRLTRLVTGVNDSDEGKQYGP